MNRNSSVFHELSEVLDISADDFIRTTDERHIRGVHEFWRRLRPEDVYKTAYTGLYCVGCEDFLTERDLVDGLCPDHAKAPVEVREEDYFFRLSAYQARIEELLASGSLRVVPEERRNEVLSFVRQGLQDISISRASERSSGWGIPVPGDPSQVIYVWIDALINYISGLGFGSRPDWDRYWNADSTRVHVIGKNVWKFHAVYWPALLLSAGLPLPDEIVVHGFLTEHGRKISKSLGNAIDPFDCARQVGVDGLRYYLLRAVNPFVDGDFSAERLKEVYNADLANGLGNLVSRLTKLCEKAGYGAYRHNGMPDAPTGYHEALAGYEFDRAIGAVWSLVDGVNQSIQRLEPWKLIKTHHAQIVKPHLTAWLHEVYRIAYWIAPFLPRTARAILEALSHEPITQCPPIFPRIATDGNAEPRTFVSNR